MKILNKIKKQLFAISLIFASLTSQLSPVVFQFADGQTRDVSDPIFNSIFGTACIMQPEDMNLIKIERAPVTSEVFDICAQYFCSVEQAKVLDDAQQKLHNLTNKIDQENNNYQLYQILIFADFFDIPELRNIALSIFIHRFYQDIPGFFTNYQQFIDQFYLLNLMTIELKTLEQYLRYLPGGNEITTNTKEYFQAQNIRLELDLPSKIAIAITSDGRFLVSGFWDKTVKIYERQPDSTYLSIYKIQDHNDEVPSVAITPDGSFLVSGSWDKTVKIYERQPNGTYLLIDNIQDPNSITSVSITSNGRFLYYVSSQYNTVKVYERQATGTYHLTQNIQDHNDMVTSVAITHNGKFLVSGSWDRTVKVYERQATGTYHLIQNIQDHNDKVSSVAITPDGRFLVAGSWDKTVKVYERQTTCTYHLIQNIQDHNDKVSSVAITPDGRFLVAGSLNGTVKVHERQVTGTYHLTQNIQDNNYAVLSVVITPNGRFLASGSWDGTIKMYYSLTPKNITIAQYLLLAFTANNMNRTFSLRNMRTQITETVSAILESMPNQTQNILKRIIFPSWWQQCSIL